MNATPIALDDLPRHSGWPGILLGRQRFSPRRRTRDEVLREYDREKWGAVLKWLRTQTQVHPEDLWRVQGLDPARPIAFGRGQGLFIAPAGEVMAASEQILFEALEPHRTGTLVELGCGLGDKLLRMADRLEARVIFGGEFTASGVTCGRLLAKLAGVQARFEAFDYLDPATLEAVPEGALVFTSHSIEQIPQLPEAFIRGLIRRAPRTVVHFEPCYEDHSEGSLLGLLRRRYTELNDYNRNLAGLLQSFEARGQIRILEHRREVFGINPFNPFSVLVWQPDKVGFQRPD